MRRQSRARANYRQEASLHEFKCIITLAPKGCQRVIVILSESADLGLNLRKSSRPDMSSDRSDAQFFGAAGDGEFDAVAFLFSDELLAEG